MDELTQLAIKYKTDKWGKHNYTPVYYEMFKDRRNEVKKVLEIGVAEGAGLRMFREFFPNALIYGIDNQDNRIFEEPGIKVFKADQSSKDQLLEVWDEIVPGPNDVDLIIDDGSHISDHQFITAMTLVPIMDTQCIYIIEDVADRSIFDEISKKNDIKTQYLRLSNRYDDCLIICQK